MRRFSIARFMFLIAVIAGGFAVMRLLDPLAWQGPAADLTIVLVGLLPLAVVEVAGLWWITGRYRIRVRQRENGGTFGYVAFLAFIGQSLLFLLPVCAIGTPEVSRWLLTVLGPIRSYWPNGLQSPTFRFVVGPCLVSAVLSGPFLLIGFAVGRFAGKYELVVRPRSETLRSEQPAGFSSDRGEGESGV